MNWIAPFRDSILSRKPLLSQHGFSWIGEDDHAIKFTDGEVLLTFYVERNSDSLGVWVRHLGERSSDEEFRVDMVMRVMDGATTQDFMTHSLQERDRLIGRYIDYVLQNKHRLFGPVCPYGVEYEAFERRVMEHAMAQWSSKP